MIIHRERDVRHGKDQDRAATVGGRFRARRWVTRLLYRLRGRRSQNSSGLDVARSDVPGAVRQRILREYHDARVARARRTSEQLVRAGFNTGGVPYGYRARHLRVTPAGRRPRWRTRLVIEPVEAATVKMIFYWRGAEGLAVTVIRERLVAARYPAPLNPGIAEPGVWTHAIITAILRNPKYVGRQVWGRRHYGRRAPREVWVWSPVWAHPPIVSAEEFVAANRDTRLALTLPVAEGSTAERTVGGRHD